MNQLRLTLTGYSETAERLSQAALGAAGLTQVIASSQADLTTLRQSLMGLGSLLEAIASDLETELAFPLSQLASPEEVA